MNRYLITSALPYANGYLHLGHCAGAYLPADIYARYLRLKGKELLWICGSDEHGVAITIAAEKEKVTPQQIIDKYHNANQDAFKEFGMSFDIYSRTSLPGHHETAKEFFNDFLSKGYLREKEEEQFYDNDAKMFLPDRYVEGICPNCGSEGARGDQCDSCGAYYNQTELKEPKSLVTRKKPVVKKTTHWYMKFGEFQEFLESYIESHSKDWKANVLQQTKSWLKQGLTDRAITRDLDWGVKLEGIDNIPDDKAKGKALYVWFEAVLGYISATKDLMKNLGKDNNEWEKWWKDESTKYIAFIGKDNIVFHTLIFPALLHAKGGYILPDNVPANEFLNLEGEKFSKSRNWSIDLRDFIADFPEKKYVDALRYTLAMNFPETRDSDFTWKDYQARNNNELAAIFGNFINRTLQFLNKNFEGKIPQLPEKYKDLDKNWFGLLEIFSQHGKQVDDFLKDIDDERTGVVMSSRDIELLWSLWNGINLVENNYGRYRFRDALTETMNIARACNKFFNDEEPWKTVKSNPDDCVKTMYICMQLVRSLAILFAPVVPFASEKIFSMLGIEQKTGKQNYGTKQENNWNSAVQPALKSGLKVSKPEILFARIEDETVQAQMDKLGGDDKENIISYEDFMKVKLRTAKIISAEKIKKSKKLLKLKVDLGDHQRQVIAGISEHYAPEELPGKTVIVVANLKPAKIMGQESQGMILAAGSEELSLLIPDKPETKPGEEVR